MKLYIVAWDHGEPFFDWVWAFSWVESDSRKKPFLLLITTQIKKCPRSSYFPSQP